ncbi:UNVERIFIED_CONTAM: hypothetical protein GTU68_005226 [Idotea baltica]|nr:hypothetical protein [Idotea baltica]
MKLVTPQTGEQGKLVRKVWVEAGAAIKNEYYLSVLTDRDAGAISIVACREGGMEIEEIAEREPEKILTIHVNPETGLQGFHCRRVCQFLGLDKAQAKTCAKVIASVYKAYNELDCSMIEINPLIVTEDDQVICLDAKVSIDDTALYRQRAAFEFMDYDEIDAREVVAKQVGINYVALDGNIGCMVNGAGLAMSTMDIIQLAGGTPANFLDVGGGANAEQVHKAFQLLLADDAVKGVLVNIFGGILRCDVLAEGIISAAKDLKIEVPLVVRMRGTNVEEGKQMLAESGLKIVSVDELGEAAAKIVELVQQ